METIQWLCDFYEQLSKDGMSQVYSALAGVVACLGYLSMRRRGKEERVRVSVDAPKGEKVVVQIGEDDLIEKLHIKFVVEGENVKILELGEK